MGREGTTVPLMCRGWECARLGSAIRRVSFYVSLVGGGLRLSGSSSGNNGNVYIGHESDWGEYLRTTGPGPRTTWI